MADRTALFEAAPMIALSMSTAAACTAPSPHAALGGVGRALLSGGCGASRGAKDGADGGAWGGAYRGVALIVGRCASQSARLVDYNREPQVAALPQQVADESGLARACGRGAAAVGTVSGWRLCAAVRGTAAGQAKKDQRIWWSCMPLVVYIYRIYRAKSRKNRVCGAGLLCFICARAIATAKEHA